MDFQSQALKVEANQVWTVQTASDKFAKIWIKDIQVMTGSVEYVELAIKYQYQPDGTKTFP